MSLQDIKNPWLRRSLVVLACVFYTPLVVTMPTATTSSQPRIVLPVMRRTMPTLAPPSGHREYPDRMYVDVPTVIRTFSVTVFIICLFSLFVTVITGFSMISPLFSVMIAFFAAGFSLMGELLRRKTIRK